MLAIPPELGRRYDTLLERKGVAVEQRPHYRKWLPSDLLSQWWMENSAAAFLLFRSCIFEHLPYVVVKRLRQFFFGMPDFLKYLITSYGFF